MNNFFLTVLWAVAAVCVLRDEPDRLAAHLASIADGERTVGELAKPFAISLAAASKHIKALEKAGLIRREVRGRTHLCHLDPGPLAGAHAWLSFYERFWTGRLDVLELLLRDEDARRSPAPKTGEDR